MAKSYILVYNARLEQLKSELSENRISEYIILNNQIASIYVNDDFKEETLNNLKYVYEWMLSIPMSSLIKITDNLSDGESVITASGIDYIDKNPYIDISGKGSMIVILDSGINYLHPDFINTDGSTNIISIWDQESTKKDPPDGLLFGSEFSREEINEYIRENNASLSTDDIGTGTISAGIACGKGNLNPLYKGVATGSELLVIKLRKYKDTYKQGRINYELSDFLAGIKYAIQVAQRENKYMIVNITIGERSRSIVETTMLNSFDYLNKSGVIVVGGAGNEGNTDIHYEGKINNLTDTQDILIQVGNQKNLDISLSVNGPDKIGASLISPSGEISYQIQYSPDDDVYQGQFNIEGTSYTMKFLYPWIKSGNEELVIFLKDIKPGIWTLRLFPEFIISGEYDVYLPNKNLIDETTRFIDPNSFSTITLLATVSEVITIGAYNDKIDSIWIGSSKGPVKGKPVKPDIVAPGVDIIGPYQIDSYITGTGTGISSSIVSGIVAILLEFVTTQSKFSRNLLFTETIKTYLMLGAIKQELYTHPDDTRGYGVLDLENTLSQISKILR